MQILFEIPHIIAYFQITKVYYDFWAGTFSKDGKIFKNIDCESEVGNTVDGIHQLIFDG